MPELSNVANADIYRTAQPQTGMSLADMLNISRSSLALQKEKELYGPSVEQAKAQSKLAQVQATGAEQKMPIEVQSAQTQLNTQQLTNLTQQANTSIKAMQILSSKENLTKEDIIKEATELNKTHGGSPEALKAVLQSLPQNATPTQLKGWLARKQLQTLDSLAALEKQYPSPQMTNLGNVTVPVQTGNEIFTGQPTGKQVGMASTLGVSPQTIRVNGVEGTLDAGGNFKPLGGENVTPNPVTPVKEKPEIISGETKVISAGGVPQLNDQQKQAYEAATKEKAGYKDLTENVKEADKTVETALKKLSEAKGSAPGRMVRSAGKWITGNEDLEILTKSLADLSVRQSKLMGAGTDAANEAVAKTQGNADLTEGGLRSILQRISATNTAWKDYTKASMAYESNRGIYGANVNHEQFKKAWASNYDTNIFILQNIYDSNLSKSEKELEAQKLFKGMSDAQMKEFERKAKNIHALENGSYK
jgi:DNA-binding XRE family transcriptional regulator